MDKEVMLKNYQDLINLGFNDEISLQAAHNYPDLESAIDFILSKNSTFNDKETIMNQNELNMPLIYTNDINNSSNSAYTSDPMFKNSSNAKSFFKSSPQYYPHSNSESFQSPPNPFNGPSSFQVPHPEQTLKPLSQFQAPLPFPNMPSQNTPFNSIPNEVQSHNSFNPQPKANFQNAPGFPSLTTPEINYPQKIKNHYNSDCIMQGSDGLDHQSCENEPFYDFLVNCLRLRGQDEDIISEICSNCLTKEEALLILDIPTFYKSTPFSKIPTTYIMPDTSPSIPPIPADTPDKIKQELLNAGAPPEVAASLSINCGTIEEAMQIFYYSNEFDDSPSHIYKPSPPHPPPPPPAKYQAPKHYMIPTPAPLNIFPSKYNPSQADIFMSDSPSSSISFEGSGSSYECRSSISVPLVLNQISENDPKAPELKTIYFENLKNYRVMLSESPTAFSNFRLGQASSFSSNFTKRINHEIKSLESTLPCDSTASIFTLIDQTCMHRIYFLLSGTLDTPYSHGLYLFEVLLPDNYPLNPPKVELRTTGGSSIRFNPNLYANGYVCLSIINTWSGRPEEQWIPTTSSLVQVMISIQSLVMDNNILQKEPGWSKYPANCPENLTYQQEVKYGNIKYAMIENIKNPPKGFEEVVRNHFKCKKQEILETTSKWTQEMKNIKKLGQSSQNPTINAEINQKGPFKAFSDLNSELATLLNKL